MVEVVAGLVVVVAGRVVAGLVVIENLSLAHRTAPTWVGRVDIEQAACAGREADRGVCAVLAGARSLAAIGEWATDAPALVLTALRHGVGDAGALPASLASRRAVAQARRTR